MPCPLAHHLPDALANPQDPSLPPGLTEHWETCEECREMAALWDLLGEGPPPDAGLPARFRARLHREIHPAPAPWREWLLPMAATLLVALGGAFGAGYALRRDSRDATPQQAILAQMRRGQAGDRMEAIALVSATRGSDPELGTALLERVTQDPRTEVRLAAVEALYLFGADPGLGHRVAEALPRQDRPEVQLAMVDLLVALRERRAAEALRHLVQDGRLSPETRRRAALRLSEQRM